MHKKRLLILLAGAAFMATPTLAQEATQEAPGSGTTLGEVVVTASRVQSSAQRTAVALTVYGSEDLVEQGVANVQALATIDPSLNMVSRTGAAYIAVRGIASTDLTEIGDPSVPVARDGFFTNRSFSIQSSMYDLERVEVLKGPQGTLFGRNSTGGLISIVTKKPGARYGGYLVGEIGNYSAFNLEGAVNLPISDKVQLRLSGISRQHDGYRRLTVLNAKGDDEGTWSARAQLAFQPLEGLTGLISYQHDDIDAVGDVAAPGRLGVDAPPADANRFPSYQPNFTRLQGDRIRWEFSYDQLPGHLTLTYAGGYDEQTWGHATDATGPQPGSAYAQFLQSEKPKTWNQEVRIATPTDQPVTAQVGYFNYKEDNTVGSGVIHRTGAFANRYLVRFDYDVAVQSQAVFGQAGWQFADDWKLTAGARYTEDKKRRTGSARLDLAVATGGAGPNFVVVTPSNGAIDQSRATYHLGLDWTPTNTSLVYAKFDTGYKSGGFNSNGSAPSVDYGPENLDAWELGTKNRFLDNRLQLNAAAFYQKYQGYQASQTTPAISTGSGVFNIGDAAIKGLELQAIALVETVGRLDLNVTLLKAEFGDSVGSVRDGAGVSRSVAGNRLPNAPGFSLSAGFEHEFALSSGALTARIDGKYSSAYYFSVFNNVDERQDAYATGNLSLIYQPASAQWKLQGFVRNVTDEAAFSNAYRQYTTGVQQYQYQPPRTYGVRATYNF